MRKDYSLGDELRNQLPLHFPQAIRMENPLIPLIETNMVQMLDRFNNLDERLTLEKMLFEDEMTTLRSKIEAIESEMTRKTQEFQEKAKEALGKDYKEWTNLPYKISANQEWMEKQRPN